MVKVGKDIVVFGNNSILAKNFIKKFDEINNLINISREGGQGNSLKLNLGKLMLQKELDNICSRIENFSKFNNKVFILFAWAGRPRTSALENTWNVNTNIIFNFLEISKKLLPSKIVFISSTTVYKENNNKSCTELDFPYPESEYGKQKLIAEYVFENFSKNYDSSIINLRVSSAYGFDPRFSDQGVINKWIFDAIKYRKLTLFNSKESKINFVSFDQITKAINISIEKNLHGTYNIACQKSLELKEIIRKIKLIIKDDLELELKDEKLRNIDIDTSKFYSETGILFENNVINNIEFIYSLIKEELN